MGADDLDLGILTELLIEAYREHCGPDNFHPVVDKFIEILAQQTKRPGDAKYEPDMSQAEFEYVDGAFAAGVIDCPWKYNDHGFNGFESVQEYRIHCPYEQLSVTNLAKFMPEVGRIFKQDAYLFFCTTKDFIPHAFWLLTLCGFEYKNIITWAKLNKSWEPTYGMGHWFRNAAEFVLLGVRGKPPRLKKATSTGTILYAPRLGHSQKPPELFDLIRENTDGPRISIFERTPRDGFYGWGDQFRKQADNSEEARSILKEYQRLKDEGVIQ